MNGLELVLDGEGQMYKLLRDPESSRYYFNALVGGIFTYSVEFPLNDDEVEAYQKKGRSYLDYFAKDVRAHPDFYKGRNKPSP